MAALLVLQGGERRLSVRGGALVVELKGEPVSVLRPADVEEVLVYGDAAITPAARRTLLWKGIDVVFHTVAGRVQGRLSSLEHRAGERRLAQLAAVSDPARRLAVARAIVAGKLRNQHTVLARFKRRSVGEPLADALALIRVAAERAHEARDLDQLRGIEGSGARAYFSILGVGLSNPLFSFTGRNRRPPRDPVNAALSFLYTLLCQRCGQLARTAGMDPYVGFLHDAGRGHEALAFDLAEEWRPLVDALVLGLFNRRQLAPEDFMDPEVDLSLVGAPVAGSQDDHPQESGAADSKAVYLGPVGRGIVITAWSRRQRERLYYPAGQGRFQIREIQLQQARLLAREMAKDEPNYVPFLWR